MISFKERNNTYQKIISIFVVITFVFTCVMPPQARAQIALPTPGVMVPVSAAYMPVMVNGITVHPENPLEFDFIINNGDTGMQGEALKKESKKLIKYFLASLTVPEKDLWVNLSPYEKDRVIADSFGVTEMGRDLLAQDYILKQLTSTMMYPEDEFGKEFWNRVYEKAMDKYGTMDIPLDTFNKIWIVPEKATIYQKGTSAYVVENKLKVMLEKDFLAIEKNKDARFLMPDTGSSSSIPASPAGGQDQESSIQTDIIKEVLIPEIEKEVNSGKNFAPLRQMANAIVLASWYKQNLKESLLGKVYVDQAKTKGIEQEDVKTNQKIYEQYLEAFNKGVYNYIKEEYDPATQEVIPRKYFSGGAGMQYAGKTKVIDQAMAVREADLIQGAVQGPAGSENKLVKWLAMENAGSDKAAELTETSIARTNVLSLTERMLLTKFKESVGTKDLSSDDRLIGLIRSFIAGDRVSDDLVSLRIDGKDKVVHVFKILTDLLEEPGVAEAIAQSKPGIFDAAMTASDIRERFLKDFRIQDPASRELGAKTREFWLYSSESERLNAIIEAYLNGREIDDPIIEAVSADGTKNVNVISFLESLALSDKDQAMTINPAAIVTHLKNNGIIIDDSKVGKVQEALGGARITSANLNYLLGMSRRAQRGEPIESILAQTPSFIKPEFLEIIADADKAEEPEIDEAMTSLIDKVLSRENGVVVRLGDLTERDGLFNTLLNYSKPFDTSFEYGTSAVSEDAFSQLLSIADKLFVSTVGNSLNLDFGPIVLTPTFLRDLLMREDRRDLLISIENYMFIIDAIAERSESWGKALKENPYVNNPYIQKGLRIIGYFRDALDSLRGTSQYLISHEAREKVIQFFTTTDSSTRLRILGEIKAFNERSAERILGSILNHFIAERFPTSDGYGRQPSDEAMAAKVLARINPKGTKSWKKLEALAAEKEKYDLRKMFSEDPDRAEKMTFELNPEMEVDFSKNLVDESVIGRLIDLANEVDLKTAIQQMFEGEKINETENRAVLHTALRNVKRDDTGKLVAADGPVYVDGKDVMPDIIAVLEHMESFIKDIHSGKWRGASGKKITDVVNIGIGGSDLGPKMAAEALKPYKAGDVNVHFVSNIDGTAAVEIINKLDPETTLVNIVSKTFTTQETMQNARTFKKWILDAYNGDERVIKDHFIACSTAEKLVSEFGIDTKNMFGFWDWVGGRFSTWSAVGLTLAIYIGFDNFLEFLEGGHEADQHFRNQPFESNIPVLKALLNVWYGDFMGAESFAILPYDQYMSLFPAFSQQFFMESNGKSVDRSGNFVDYPTGLIAWGAAGTDGQHSFYQLIHQGTRLIPADFIGIINTHNALAGHHDKLFANFVAQTEALAFGATKEEVKAQLAVDPKYAGKDIDWHAAQQTFTGNKPTTSILIDKMTPRTLGNLVALYEDQIFVEGFIWNIFSFDQWGVQLGKVVAKRDVLPYLDGTKPLSEIHNSNLSPSGIRAVTQYIKRKVAGTSEDRAMLSSPEEAINILRAKGFKILPENEDNLRRILKKNPRALGNIDIISMTTAMLHSYWARTGDSLDEVLKLVSPEDQDKELYRAILESLIPRVKTFIDYIIRRFKYLGLPITRINEPLVRAALEKMDLTVFDEDLIAYKIEDYLNAKVNNVVPIHMPSSKEKELFEAVAKGLESDDFAMTGKINVVSADVNGNFEMNVQGKAVVILVEDDTDLLEQYKDILEAMEGFDALVVFTQDLHSFLKVVERVKDNLKFIITDGNFPAIDHNVLMATPREERRFVDSDVPNGVHLVQIVKGEMGINVPIVALTGEKPGSFRKGVEFDVDRHISKQQFSKDPAGTFRSIFEQFFAKESTAQRLSLEAIDALKNVYEKDGPARDDYDVEPIVTEGAQVKDGDIFFWINHRPDRSVGVSYAFVDPEFNASGNRFDTAGIDVDFVPFAAYDPEFFKAHGIKPVFTPDNPNYKTISQIFQENGVEQGRFAETDKGNHVTSFYDGGKMYTVEKYAEMGIHVDIVSSESVPDKDKNPDMKYDIVAQHAVDYMESKKGSDKKQAILVNLAMDIQGHVLAGDKKRGIHTVLATDKALGKIRDEVKKLGGVLIVTADHGNLEEMAKLDENGIPFTDKWGVIPSSRHSVTNPVPFIVEGLGDVQLKDGLGLSSIEPTRLEIMGIDIPEGKSESILEDYKYKEIKGPVVVVVLDGWGMNRFTNKEALEWDAIHLANPPVFNDMMANDPHTLLKAHGDAVGLPDDEFHRQMGDSDNGHKTIGAGQIIPTLFGKIMGQIDSGEIFDNPLLREKIKKAIDERRDIDIGGLISDGGIHSHYRYVLALIELCAKMGVKDAGIKIKIHAALDGRDVQTRVPTESGAFYLTKILEKAKEVGLEDVVQIGTIIGRADLMDRDAVRREKANKTDEARELWNARFKKAYDAMVYGKAGTVIKDEAMISKSQISMYAGTIEMLVSVTASKEAKDIVAEHKEKGINSLQNLLSLIVSLDFALRKDQENKNKFSFNERKQIELVKIEIEKIALKLVGQQEEKEVTNKGDLLKSDFLKYLKMRGNSQAMINRLVAMLNDDNKPIVLDVGTGDGKTVMNLAQSKADVNFVGIDVNMPKLAVLFAEKGIGDQGPFNNLTALRFDFASFIKAMPDNSISRLLFINPIPTKGVFGMMLSGNNLDNVKRVLTDDGEIIVKLERVRNKGVVHSYKSDLYERGEEILSAVPGIKFVNVGDEFKLYNVDLSKGTMNEGGDVFVGTVVDEAISGKKDNVGGINLDPSLFDLQIKRDDAGIPLPIDQQPIESMHIDGFVPIIINIQPVNNVPLLLGLADTKQGPNSQQNTAGREHKLQPADRKAKFEAKEVEQLSYLN